ncbi:MAG: 50S ribosomal protein L32 [Candidatus Rhabdochlamydia sp.]
MAVPRNRLSNARKNSRRAHHAKTPKNVIQCGNCNEVRIPHRVCKHCGHYDGKAVIKEATS